MLSGWFARAASPTTAPVVKPAEPVHVPDELLIRDIISPDDQPFEDLYKQQKASFWPGGDELKFVKDVPHLAKLSPKARRLFEYILAFFATADGEVLENAVVNFMKESESLSIRMAYSAQVFFESIHIETYAAAMVTYIPDPARRNELTMAFKTDPLIKERDDWMTRYIALSSATEKNKAKRLIAFACAEGLFFMSAFMVIAWWKSCELFPVFARANEFISRDEWFHVKIGIARFKRLYRSRLDEIGLTEEEILDIVREAVELECRFARSLVPASTDEDRFDGLKVEDLILHIQNLGNVIVKSLGFSTVIWKVDPSKLPPWVTWIQVQPKTNFYEGEVSSYTVPIDESEDPTRDTDF